MTDSLTRAPSPSASPARRRGVTLAVVLVTQLMVVLDASIVNIALPHLATELDFSPTGLSWVVNAYVLVFGGLLLLGARAGDIFGRRRVLMTGMAVFILASLAGGLAADASLLLAARALQGVGAALAAPSALAILMTMFPDAKERTKALGWYTAVSIGGAAVGLIAGGMLVQWVSWRWVFFVNVPIGLAVWIAARRLPSSTTARGHIDVAGALTSTIGMTALVYGFVRAAADGWNDPLTIGSFALGAVMLGAFVMIERTAEVPITPLRLFADRDRSTAYLARMLLVAGMMGMFFFLTQFLQEILNYSALTAGLAFLPLTVTVFTMSQVSARVLMARIPAKLLIAGGLSFSTAGLFWLSFLSGASTYIDVLGPLLLFGFGNGVAFVPLTATGLRGVAPADTGAASGLINVTQQVGGAVGLAVLVTVFGSVSRNAQTTPGASAALRAQEAFVAGADRGFLTATLFLAATVVLVLVALRPTPRKSQERTGAVPALVAAEA